MKRIVLWMLMVLLALTPVPAIAEGETDDPIERTDPATTGDPTGSETPGESTDPITTGDPTDPVTTGDPTDPETTDAPVIGESLSIDTVHIYEGMAKSYAQGYLPTVENNTATVVLPLIGNALGNRIRVTPELSSGGPYVLGNYQFDVVKTRETATDLSVNDVFLVRLMLPLTSPRTNGTYPIPLTVEYVAADGTQAQQSFTVQLSITDGKNASSDSGGYYQPSVNKPIVLVDAAAVEPALLCGGDTATATLTLSNVGTYDAKNLRISLMPETDALTVGELNAQFLSLLPVKKTTEASFDLTVTRGAPGKSEFVTARIEYEDRLGNSYSEESRFAVVLTQPRVEIVSCEYSETVGGGDDVTVTLTLQNTGGRKVDGVTVAYADGDDALRRKGVSDAVDVGAMQPDESKEVVFELRALPSASEGKHTFGFALSYRDAASGGAYADRAEYPLTVVQKAQLGYDEVRLPESIVSGESFSQPICVYNTGFTPIYNVRCTLDCDGLICSSAFLGTVEPQQSADKTMTVFVTTLSGGQKYGTTYGSFQITYEDADGQRYSEYLTVQMNIAEPQQQTDEEKERERQKVEEQQLLTQWWVSVLIGVAIICILISVLVISKFMRMLKMK